MLLNYLGIGYWGALILAPIIVGFTGVILERTMIARLYKLDHLYGLLLTFGVGLIIEGLFRNEFGSSGLPYRIPEELNGGINLGFMFLPKYRAWVIVSSLIVCVGTWFVIERTKLGAYLRAGTENAPLTAAFGVNVPVLRTFAYAFGVGLAGLAGVLAAPIYQVQPLMGSNLIIVVFAVVVIGGMGSIMGSIITGLALGVIEGFTKVFYPEASSTVVFVIMAIVLLLRPAGLFGKEK
jgi:branched-chain amino acid transport system permease protein